MIKLTTVPKRQRACWVLWARGGLWDRKDRRAAKKDEMRGGIRLLSMWVASSELPAQHRFSSLFHFLHLNLSQADVQSPREISHPARCGKGVVACVCVCVCVWGEERMKARRTRTGRGWEGGATRTKLFSVPRLIIPLLYLKIDAGMKKGHQSKHQKMCCSNRKSLAVLCCAVLHRFSRGHKRKDWKWKWRRNPEEPWSLSNVQACSTHAGFESEHGVVKMTPLKHKIVSSLQPPSAQINSPINASSF